MQIKNVKVHELYESIIASGYPMQVGEPEDLDNDFEFEDELLDESDYKRVRKLANTPPSSGHSNFRKGILVSFDIKYAQYFTPQLQRYSHLTIVSSQSKMHKLTSRELTRDDFGLFVLQSTIDNLNKWIKLYNCEGNEHYPYLAVHDADEKYWMIVKDKTELFKLIIQNLPMGYEMWMRCTTNYEQLATIYRQRKTHKLDDWRKFCKWIESLPMSELIIGEMNKFDKYFEEIDCKAEWGNSGYEVTVNRV